MPDAGSEPEGGLPADSLADAGLSPVAVAYSGLSAPIVRAEVALATAEELAPVVGSFTEAGMAFAIQPDGTAMLVAAAGDGASTLSIPASVEHDGVAYEVSAIGAHALSLCGAATVAIPASVASIDEDALWPTSAQRVEVDPANPTYASYDGILYDATLSRLLSIPEGRQGAVRIIESAQEVEASALSHSAGVDALCADAGGAHLASWDGLLYTADGTTLLRVPPAATSVTIRDGCTTVAPGALEGCAALERIEAPATVVDVSPDAYGEGASATAPAADAPTPVVHVPAGAPFSAWEAAGLSAASLPAERISADMALSPPDEGEGESASALPASSLAEGEGDSEPESAAPIAEGASTASIYDVVSSCNFNPNGGVLRIYAKYCIANAGTAQAVFDETKTSDWGSWSSMYVCDSAYSACLYASGPMQFWVAGSWTVTAVDGSVYQVPYGDWLFYMNPSRPGYSFAGWHIGSPTGPLVTTNGIPASNTTYYASWTPKTCGLSFSANGGTWPSSAPTGVIATYGSAMLTTGVTKPTAPAGYTFAGYYDGTGASATQYYTASLASARTWDKDTSETTTLYARWTKSVTLDRQGGTGGSTSATYVCGVGFTSSITTPTAPSGGWTFLGYFDYKPDRDASTGSYGAVYQFFKSDGAPRELAFDSIGTTLYAWWVKQVTLSKYASGATEGKVTSIWAVKGGKLGSVCGSSAKVEADVLAKFPSPSPLKASGWAPTWSSTQGWAFDGFWTSGSSPSATQYIDEDGSVAAACPDDMPSTLYAQWVAQVELDKQGGSDGSDYAEVVYGGTTYAYRSVEAPTLEGWDFLGYCDYKPSATVSGDVWQYIKSDGSPTGRTTSSLATRYAWWVKEVALDKNASSATAGSLTTINALKDAPLGYVCTTTAATEAEVRAKFPKPSGLGEDGWAPTRAGYTFGGYYGTSSGTSCYLTASGEGYLVVPESLGSKIYAYWTSPYSATFNAGEGGTLKVVIAQVGSAADGSHKAADVVFEGKGPYVATWSGATQIYNTGVVHFWDKTGGYLHQIIPLRPGYRLLGWTGTSNVNASTGNVSFTAGGTYTAVWGSLRSTTLDAGGGSLNVYSYFGCTSDPPIETGLASCTIYWGGSSTIYGNATDHCAHFTVDDTTKRGVYAVRPGYTFAGWAGDDPVPTGTKKTPLDGVTYIATWDPNRYTVEFDANGGSGGQSSEVVATYGQAISSERPLRTGYAFKGWWDVAEPTGGTQYYTESCASARTWDKAGAATLYARWAPASYAVELDANGERATVSPESLECAYDEDVALPTPERYGYAFLGWDTERDGTGTRYQAGVVRNLAEEDGATVALYAQWSLITNVELPITAAASVGFELGVPDGAIRVAGTEDEPMERAEGWVRSKMPVEVRLDSISCEPAGDAASAGTDAERFWADNAGYADVSVQPAGSAASAMVLSAGDSVAEAAIPSWFTIPAATSATDLGELKLLYGLSLDRLFADPADGGAGVDIASLLPEGDGESFGIPTGLLRLVLTVDVSKYAG